MRTIITTDYGEARLFSGDSGKIPVRIVTTLFGPTRSGGPRKQGLTSRARSGHPKHGLAGTLGSQIEVREDKLPLGVGNVAGAVSAGDHALSPWTRSAGDPLIESLAARTPV